MSGLFGKPAGATAETYAGMQISTSLMGQVIPYIAGRTRVNSNLVWYGNFQQQGSSGSGGKGGGSSNSTVTYSAAWIAVLCLGPITNVFQVFHDRSIVTLAYENLSLALGATGQPTWSGYPSGTPAGQQIPYSNLAYVATPLYNFGSSPSMPALTFETEAGGIVNGYSDAHNMFDADCADIITDYLTNAVTGAGFLGTINNTLLYGTSNSYQAYCWSLGIGLSPYENNQRAATDFIKEQMQITNSDVVLSCGILKVIPYADTAVSGTTADGVNWSYTPNLTPVFVFGNGDFCPRTNKRGVPIEEPVQLKRKALRDTFNIVNVEYLDRTNYYNPAPAPASDNNDIAYRGPKCMPTVTLHQITSPIVARQAAQLILNQQLYERNTYIFRVRSDYWQLEPMDMVSISDTGLGLTNQVCRITEITEDKDFFLQITAMEVPGTIRNTPQYNWNSAQGFAQNFNQSPGSVQAPVIFAMPPVSAGFSAGITIGIAVCGQAANAFWGGCNVHVSLDGGSTYETVGQVGPNGPGRYGTLTSSLPLVADPDTSSTLAIALSNTNLQLSTAVTHAEADACQTLILVGTGSSVEVMAYGTASLASAGHYNLSYLRRGLYQTNPHAQLSGAQFVRLDGAIFTIAMDSGMAGQTVMFKFTSVNTVGRAEEDISTVTAYSYTIPANFGGVAVYNSTWESGGTCAMLSPTSAYKLTTGAAAWDSSIFSAQAFTNGCTVQCYPVSPTNDVFMVGLTTNPLASNSYTNLNFALYAASGTGILIYESGTLVGTFATSYTSSTLLEIVYDGKHVSYYIAGQMVRSVATANKTFYAQFCLEGPGAGIYGMSFSSSALATQPFTLVPMSANVAAAGTQVTNNGLGTSSWGIRNFKSAESFANGVSLSFSPNQSAPASQHESIGFSLAPATGGSTVNSNMTAGWYMDANTIVALHGGGFAYSLVTTILASDVFTLTYDNFTFYWWRNGALLHTEYDPGLGPLFLFGDIFEATQQGFLRVAFEPYGQATPNPFVSNGNCFTHDSTAAKVGGASAWDSAVYSLNAYSICHLQFKSSDATKAFMFGLDQNPLSSSSYTTLDFAWYSNGGGAWLIYESGTNVLTTTVTVAVTDLAAITYDGSNVRYYLNGNLMRTKAAAGLTLYASSSFLNPGAACNSLSFGPSTTLDTVPTASIDPNAVSQILSAFNNGVINTQVYGATSPVTATLATATIVCTGAPVAIDWSINYSCFVSAGGTLTSFNLAVYRDGTALTSGQGVFSNSSPPIDTVSSAYHLATMSLTDTPAAGSHTYTLVLTVTGTGSGPGTPFSGGEFFSANQFIKVREIKK